MKSPPLTPLNAVLYICCSERKWGNQLLEQVNYCHGPCLRNFKKILEKPAKRNHNSKQLTHRSAGGDCWHGENMTHSRLSFGIVSMVLSLAPLHRTQALTNGLALTPPMGWNSWNHFACNIDEAAIRSMADVMSTNGMKAAGYQFINIDDCWQISRDSNGVIVADPSRFPSGIKALADYVHSKGLKLGVYSDHGTLTCQGKPGSYGYEYLDALTYASWGVDYLKYDNCNLPPGDSTNLDDLAMANALMNSGRPIVFSLCNWSFASWMPDRGNLWRTTGDISDSFSSMMSNLNGNSPPAFVAGPGRWNDPDMLEVGNGGMTATEYQSHFSMWCLAAAPLIAGNDLTSMSAQTLAILTNAEVIAVDQDPAGEQGIKVAGSSGQVWCKPLGTDFNTKAVALFNSGSSAANITVNWTNLGLQASAATVRDLWAHTDLGAFSGSFTTNVPSHGTVMLKFVGTAPALPALGTNYLTDLQPVYVYTGWGAMTNNKSIGGNTITLNGTTYAKGLGVNSYSGLEYRLGGVAARFQADIGVDDEVGSNGSVVFQVFADGLKVFDSGTVKGGEPRQTIDLDVTGVNRLTLGVNDADDGNSYDHADWAGAKVIVSNSLPAAPLSPAGLSASRGNPILLTWNVTPGTASYNVKRSSSSSGPFTNIASTILLNYADSNVIVGTTYYYVVSAVGKFGESANSTAANATACSPPAAPTSLTVTVTGAQAVLSWNPVPSAVSYGVARATSSTPYTFIASGLAATNYSDTDMVSGTTYYYVVAANNGCSQSDFSTSAVGTLAPPQPTSLIATPGGGEAALIWNPTAGAYSYRVKRASTSSGPYVTVASNVTSIPYLDTGLTAGTTCYYEISAVNSGGESPDSVYASATPCGGTLPAGWADQDIGSVGFAGNASSCSNSFIVQGGGSDIWDSPDAFNFASTSATNPGTIVARVLGVQNTDGWAKAGVMFRNDTTASSMYVDLVVTPVNGVSLQWRSSTGGSGSATTVAGVSTPAWVKLARSGNTFSGYYAGDGINWTLVGTANASLANSALAGLAVTAHNNSFLCLAAFDSVSTSAPAAPAGLTATSGNGQVSLSWSASAGATSYNVKSSTVSGGLYTVVATNVAGLSWTATGLTNGTTYYFVVSALNPIGESVNSSQVSATPSAPVPPVLSLTESGTNLIFSWNPANGHLEMTPALGGTNIWTDVASTQPVTVLIGPSNAFFRVVVP